MAEAADGRSGREEAEDLRPELERVAASDLPYAERAQRVLDELDEDE